MPLVIGGGKEVWEDVGGRRNDAETPEVGGWVGEERTGERRTTDGRRGDDRRLEAERVLGTWHRSDACSILRRESSRSTLGHLANKNTHETETSTRNGRPSDCQGRLEAERVLGWLEAERVPFAEQQIAASPRVRAVQKFLSIHPLSGVLTRISCPRARRQE
eukprot:2049821-Pyramimonas_sp.AAC.1